MSIQSKEQVLKRRVSARRREAGIKGWDTRRMKASIRERERAGVDADSRSVARVIHGDDLEDDYDEMD